MGKFIKVYDLENMTMVYVHIEQIRLVYEPSEDYLKYWKEAKDRRAGAKSCIEFGSGPAETVYTPCDVTELVQEIERKQ